MESKANAMSTGKNSPKTLMESGTLDLDLARNLPAEVRRGMAVLTGEGHTAGHIAAVILDSQNGEVTHLVLGYATQTTEYRLVPTSLIETVDDGKVVLRIFHPLVEKLPLWRGA
jgi:hypothetical protein